MDLVKHIEKENFICKYSVTQEEVKSYGQVGRPKKNAIAQTITQYKVIIEQVQIEPSYHEKLLRNEKSFILVTSLLDRNEYSMDAILKEYKQQNNIEQVFRFLKDPIYLGAVYLKDEKRIKGLGYVFMLVLLIGCYLQHRVRQSLEERNEVLEVSKGVTHKRPTVKSIIEAIKNTLIIEMSGNRYFDTSESRNAVLFKVLDLVGFKPDIYLNYVE
ncbi:hypothetical protein [Thermotalea metallivorans]|uniref:Transposase IS4-like domain-containing protein n=1 Tax=Thermotalea metallivorans TaxID=520762 RepID=A0A140L7D3_9FIRM|nr:hypothetical protein [Thermotalea metallivorans]KXG76458.1 hypothetical protein AN619_09890 [Thermotalea metallivorans]